MIEMNGLDANAGDETSAAVKMPADGEEDGDPLEELHGMLHREAVRALRDAELDMEADYVESLPALSRNNPESDVGLKWQTDRSLCLNGECIGLVQGAGSAWWASRLFAPLQFSEFRTTEQGARDSLYQRADTWLQKALAAIINPSPPAEGTEAAQ